MDTSLIEEAKQLKNWFEEHEVPQTMQIDKATFSPDLKFTVRKLLEQATSNHEAAKIRGCVVLLKKIKANIEMEK